VGATSILHYEKEGGGEGRGFEGDSPVDYPISALNVTRSLSYVGSYVSRLALLKRKTKRKERGKKR